MSLVGAEVRRKEDPNLLCGRGKFGESGSVGAPGAVVNAAVDALRHLGVRHIDMPVTPQKLFALLRGGEAAAN